MLEKQYIGIVTKSPTDNKQVKAIYPEGAFSVVSQAGALAIQLVGGNDALAVDNIMTFKNLDDAVAWIQSSS